MVFLQWLLFLGILTIGFFYEWHRGALMWPHKQIKWIKTMMFNTFWQIINTTDEFFFFDQKLFNQWLQNFSWVDLVQNLPEIYLTLVIFIGLNYCWNCQFSSRKQHLSHTKKRSYTFLYMNLYARFWSHFVFYLLQIFFFENTNHNF